MYFLDLNGDWHLHSVGRNRSAPAQVPGVCILIYAPKSLIDDPFDGDNEDRLQWITATDWIYSPLLFTFTEELRRHQRLLLRCEGLDTLATIT